MFYKKFLLLLSLLGLFSTGVMASDNQVKNIGNYFDEFSDMFFVMSKSQNSPSMERLVEQSISNILMEDLGEGNYNSLDHFSEKWSRDGRTDLIRRNVLTGIRDMFNPDRHRNIINYLNGFLGEEPEEKRLRPRSFSI